MAGRIVVFGATGYTGRLVAEALVRRGHRPLLAGRNAARLAELAGDLGGDLEVAVANVADPASVRALVQPGDVLVATVGPFAKWGRAAVEAAIGGEAHYLDSTGEPVFIREVFERHGPTAAAAGVGLLTAFGYDWVPGNLAGALALRDGGPEAVRIDTGYFFEGDGGGFSGGTLASLTGALAAPSFAWRGGRMHTERGAARHRTFKVHGKDRAGLTVGSSEHFALPRIHEGLLEVNPYLGWFGPFARVVQAGSLAGAGAFKLPGARNLVGALTDRFVKGSTGGPTPEERASGGSHIVGAAYDASGKQLSEVHLTGVDGYTFTGEILAWGAERATAGALRGTGALGPVDGLGLDELEAGCRQAGIVRA